VSLAPITTNRPGAPTAGDRAILLLTHRIPYPPDKGDRIRSFHLLERLAGLGRVDLAFPVTGPVDPEALAALGRLCRRVEAVPTSVAGRWVNAALCLARGRSFTEGYFAPPALGRLVRNWHGETAYDTVVAFSSGVVPPLLGHGLTSRLVTDLVDVDSQKWFDYASRCRGLTAWLFRLEGRRVRTLERRAGRGRAVVLVTEAEAGLYRPIDREARVVVALNGVDVDFFRPTGADGNGPTGAAVFVGQLDYRANILGLEWFCREVWGAVRSRLPGAVFRIVGRNPTAAVRRLARVPGVEVVGTVPDVRPYLAEARVVVVPLPVARGVQNKVLEAMAMSRAVVASPAALEGLPLVPGRDALVAAEPDDWVRTLVDLWNSPARRLELGRHARRHVEAHHHWDTCLAPFDELVGAGALT
jgi:sugar transferase (PEP-CTERM/EpsH1 system associated)